MRFDSFTRCISDISRMGLVQRVLQFISSQNQQDESHKTGDVLGAVRYCEMHKHVIIMLPPAMV